MMQISLRLVVNQAALKRASFQSILDVFAETVAKAG